MSPVSPRPIPGAVRKVGLFPLAVESGDHGVHTGVIPSCLSPRRYEDSRDIPPEQYLLPKEMAARYLPVSRALTVFLVPRQRSQLFPVIGFREVS
jgi:hypothetical protein